MLLMIHPKTGSAVAYHKGEGALAVDAYKAGYKGLSEATNAKLAAMNAQFVACQMQPHTRCEGCGQ